MLVKISVKNQIAIPKAVLERAGLGPNDVYFDLEDDNGNILIQEAETPLDFTSSQWKEFLDKSNKEPVTRHKTKAATLRHLDGLTKKK